MLLEKGPRRGALLGRSWGLGPALALAVVAGALAWVGAERPRAAADLFELLVGIMLLGLGVRAIASALRSGRGPRTRRIVSAGAGALSLVVGLGWLGAGAGCIRESTVACAGDSDCARAGAGLVCRRAAGADGGLCTLVDAGTGACGTAADCTDPTRPICDAILKLCRHCALVDAGVPGDCPSALPYCTGTGACVECTSNNQCADKLKTCSAGVCAPCTKSTDCTTLYCVPDAGTCDPPGDVAFVNNASSACSDLMHVSTPSTPYCQINAALNVSGKRKIHVEASALAYQRIAWYPTSNQRVQVVGPGRGVSRPTINATIANALSVGASGPTVDLSFDGFDFAGTVQCSAVGGTLNLTVLNSFVRDAMGQAVIANGCNLVLDANLIGPNNRDGGINVAGGVYSITNNIIFSNGPGRYPGVTFDGAAFGTFAFNTVAKNHVSTPGMLGGIDCGPGSIKLIADSIVWGNDAATNRQTNNSCQLSTVVTGTGSLDFGGTALDPTFAGAFDFHLKKPADSANILCCVDQISAPPINSHSDHDVDNTLRPKGSKWDVGAHELQ